MSTTTKGRIDTKAVIAALQAEVLAAVEQGMDKALVAEGVKELCSLIDTADTHISNFKKEIQVLSLEVEYQTAKAVAFANWVVENIDKNAAKAFMNSTEPDKVDAAFEDRFRELTGGSVVMSGEQVLLQKAIEELIAYANQGKTQEQTQASQQNAAAKS